MKQAKECNCPDIGVLRCAHFDGRTLILWHYPENRWWVVAEVEEWVPVGHGDDRYLSPLVPAPTDRTNFLTEAEALDAFYAAERDLLAVKS